MTSTRTTENAVRRVQTLAALHRQRHTLESLIAEVELPDVMRATCHIQLTEVRRRIDSLEWQVANV